jgi:hypothetical protein
VRVFAALAVVGIVLGVAIALVAHALQAPKRVDAHPPCTTASIGLAPKISFADNGRDADVGFVAPGPAGCTVPAGGPRGVGIRIESADGKLLLERSSAGGEPPGTLIQTKLVYSTRVPALALCRARQPVEVTVWVIGLTVTAEGLLRFAGGRCFAGR